VSTGFRVYERPQRKTEAPRGLRARAKETFVFPAPLTSKRPMKSDRERPVACGRVSAGLRVYDRLAEENRHGLSSLDDIININDGQCFIYGMDQNKTGYQKLSDRYFTGVRILFFASLPVRCFLSVHIDNGISLPRLRHDKGVTLSAAGMDFGFPEVKSFSDSLGALGLFLCFYAVYKRQKIKSAYVDGVGDHDVYGGGLCLPDGNSVPEQTALCVYKG